MRHKLAHNAGIYESIIQMDYNALLRINDLCNELLRPAAGPGIPVGLHNIACVELLANARRAVQFRDQELAVARASRDPEGMARVERELDEHVRAFEEFCAKFKAMSFDERMAVGVPQRKTQPHHGPQQPKYTIEEVWDELKRLGGTFVRDDLQLRIDGVRYEDISLDLRHAITLYREGLFQRIAREAMYV